MVSALVAVLLVGAGVLAAGQVGVQVRVAKRVWVLAVDQPLVYPFVSVLGATGVVEYGGLVVRPF